MSERDSVEDVDAGNGYNGQTRGPTQHWCPVAGCTARVQNLEKHSMTHKMAQQEYHAVFGQAPFNFLRCWCKKFVSREQTRITRHEAAHGPREGEAVGAQDMAPPENQPVQDGVGNLLEDDADAGDGEVGGAAQAEPLQHGDAGYMKQPSLDTLPKANLALVMGIMVVLLKLALGNDDNAVMEPRALRALYNLAGVVKDVEYKATGK